MYKVEPIRDAERLAKFGEELRRKSDRDYLLFVAGTHTGLRISDLLPLKVGDLRDSEFLVLREKKTRKNKRIVLNPELKRICREVLAGRDAAEYAFASRQGNRPISRSRAWSIFSEAAAVIGIKDAIGTHTLRKTFGYHFYQQTHDVAMLMELFNHSSAAVTLRYIGVTQDAQDKAMRKFRLPKPEDA